VSFGDIKGQHRAVSFLKASAASGRIAQAYVFYGPKGVGKCLTALNFAKAVNCPQAGESGSCDSCPSCLKISSSNHPDVSVLGPEKDALSVGIDAVRALIRDIGLKPYELRKKFYIIDGLMKDEAANAVLKTLEEPPSDSVMIIIAEKPGDLLPTIASRAQAVKFFPLRAEEVAEILTEGHGLGRDEAHIIANLSAGRPGEAIRYKDARLMERRALVISALARGTLSGLELDKLTRTELKECLDVMLSWYRDMLVAGSAGPGGPELFNVDHRDDIARSSAATGAGRALDAIARIMETSAYLDRNANPKLAMAALDAEISR
jgi:DNA polymerase-3 subunit delta'